MKYKDSGVNIDRANQAKKTLAEHVKSTWNQSVLSEAGAFGGLFSIGGRFDDPVLVGSIDGVGTKVLVARMAGRFDTIGQDLVNHCVNDILVQGAEPLFFLDYIASGALDPDVVARVVEGLSIACKQNGCALIGGETAEMPGVYQGNDFDLAGSIVGVVERTKIIDGSTIEPGDCVLALPSTGLQTNGYSLARAVFFDALGLGVKDHVEELGCTVGDELLKIHASYLKPVRQIGEVVRVKGLAHVTGGGVVENLPRILPGGCDADIRKSSWQLPAVFEFIQAKGKVEESEMYRVFNMGLGMIVVVSAEAREQLLGRKDLPTVLDVGTIQQGSGRVILS
jgi:phosphoribosylformylglycinamidine cyclo-ligase